MLDLPIIDAHLHIWDPGTLSYPWLSDVPALDHAFLPADYRAATEGWPVKKMVFVQAEADFGLFKEEVEWVSTQAEVDPRIRAIVAWVPLEKGDGARPDLEALAENPLMRGIRRIIQFEDDPGFCLRPDFIRGVQLLASFDMTFDICIKGDDQFENTLELVRRCPEVKFMLDHIGKPFIKDGIMEPWAGYLRELAALPNTWCKISGLANEADMESWRATDLRPYLDRVLQSFGIDRVAFGGDWPVVTLASPWIRWIETLADAVSDLSDPEKRKLFHDNAASFYRI